MTFTEFKEKIKRYRNNRVPSHFVLGTFALCARHPKYNRLLGTLIKAASSILRGPSLTQTIKTLMQTIKTLTEAFKTLTQTIKTLT